MPTAVNPEDSAGNASLKMHPWHRLHLRRPSVENEPKTFTMDRLRNAVLKPPDPDAPPRSRGAYELSGEELVIEEKRANDKERAIGLVAGPLATLIGFLVIHTLVTHDPAAPNKLHVNLSTYSDLFVVLLVLSLGITAMAMWRKRLYLGIVTSLYGLAIFNLHYWGFGVPFVMVGAWYLVRAYRLHRNLRQSTADGQSRMSTPASSKRYTPPSLPQKRLPTAKPGRRNTG
jgi:hypothetical protein